MLHGECPSVRRVAGTRFPALSPSYANGQSLAANGQSLAYVYSRENENAARIAKVLTEDEARRIPQRNRRSLVLFLRLGFFMPPTEAARKPR
jgi:hypothetical protein